MNDIFSWESLNAGTNPFAESKGFETDERFYNLTKDKDGKGAAIIRFLPDGEMRENGSMGTIQKVFKINTTFEKNGKKRFVNEFSPTTIGKPDPFQEEWSKLYNANKKDESKKFNRVTRYIANIKVIKDPANPENEGKIFLLDMSYSMAQKIQNWIQPSSEDLSLGATPKALFNPLKGFNFKLISRKGANGMINYDSSAIDDTETSIYANQTEAVKDIKENAHKLSWFLDEKNYKTYDELKEKLKWVTWQDSESPAVATTSSTTTTVPETQVSQEAKSIDAELDDLINNLSR